VRHNALDEIKAASKILPKDEQFRLKEEVQEITDAAIKRIDEAISKKSAEITSM